MRNRVEAGSKRLRTWGAVLGVALTGGLACQPATEEPTSATSIISDDDQYPFVIGVVELNEAALLATAQRNEAGELSVSQAAKQRLLTEQQAFLDSLEDLGDEIQVIYRYRLVANGFAIRYPRSLEGSIKRISQVSSLRIQQTYGHPKPAFVGTPHFLSDLVPAASIERNATRFVGAEAAHERGIRGEGISVGIIDTGIDYTHKFFGGPGTGEAYFQNDSSIIEPGTFPTAKVVGGIDLVGRTYNAASEDRLNQIPKPDPDPLDDATHGTHVAGTVAGMQFGSDLYDGIAPNATLHAIKVFGAEGSTSSAVVIAGLEYAADPNGDLNLDDQLDVVNLSLGGNYGSVFADYVKPVELLSSAGTVVVCSAGNSGDTPYIVGSPSVAETAISVASSLDNSDRNIAFQQSVFRWQGSEQSFVVAVGEVGAPLEEFKDLQADIVYAGIGNDPYDEDLSARARGKIVLVDRGEKAFSVKVGNAYSAGALGVIVANNLPGSPFGMGGDTSFPIPAVMIDQEAGKTLKQALAEGSAVSAQLYTEQPLVRPELADTISDFSSRGPRSGDGLIKPEIAAPGSLILSAYAGTGDQTLNISGTSMAAPQISGVAALLKQRYPGASASLVKSLIMQTAKQIQDADGKDYTVSRQGAGRVQVLPALDATVFLKTPSLSLGVVSPQETTRLTKTLRLRGLPGSGEQQFELSFASDNGIRLVEGAGPVTVSAERDVVIELAFELQPAPSGEGEALLGQDLDGFISLQDASGQVVARAPVLAVYQEKSAVKAEVESRPAQSDKLITLTNSSVFTGTAIPLIRLGDRDPVEADAQGQDGAFVSGSCDLAQVGYKFVEAPVGLDEGGNFIFGTILQVGVELENRLTTWGNRCQVSVLIDADGDGLAEQEIGTRANLDLQAQSLLYDAPRVRFLRGQWDQGLADEKYLSFSNMLFDPELKAILGSKPVFTYANSKVGLAEFALSDLLTTESGSLRVKVGVTNEWDGKVGSDFLGAGKGQWFELSPLAQPVSGLPYQVRVDGQAKLEVTAIDRGGEVLVLFPNN